MAPSASEKAKAKFFAVIEDPKRYDTTCEGEDISAAMVLNDG